MTSQSPFYTYRKVLLLLGVVLSVIGLSLAGWRASGHGVGLNRSLPNQGASLANSLNADGTLNLPPGFSGSLDVSGYRMELTANGAPSFVPVADCGTPTGNWDPEFSRLQDTNGFILALAVIGSDIYVGGYFTLIGGISANHVAKFNMLTSTWSSFGSGDGNGLNGQVKALAVIGGDLYVAGDFGVANAGGTGATPEITANNVAKWNGNSWSALSTTTGNGFACCVYALAAVGSDLYVGGDFTKANFGGAGATNEIVVNGIVRWDGNNWFPLGSGGGSGVSGGVRSLAVIGNDLYVGGSFTKANLGGTGGTPEIVANKIAKWDGQSWSTLGSGPNNGLSNSSVNVLSVSGSDLYIVAGNIVRKWNGSVFSVLGRIWNGDVFAVAVVDGELFAGGSFTLAGNGVCPYGQCVPPYVPTVNRVARWNGSDWLPLGSGTGNGVNRDVRALAAAGRNLYLGGSFDMVNLGDAGGSITSVGIGRFTLPARTFTTLSSSTNPSIAGQPVTFQAGILLDNAISPADAGCVTFKEGGTVLAANIPVDSNGRASFTTSSLSFGVHTITAEYSGAGRLGSSSTSIAQIVNHFAGSVDDPFSCTAPGNPVAVTATIMNGGNATQTVSFTAQPNVPGQIVVVPNSCVVTGTLGGTCNTAPGQVTFNGSIAAGQTATIRYLVQIGDQIPGTQVCITSTATFGGGGTASVTACGNVNCPPVGPGALPSSASPASDQKAGSVLVYNIYTSSLDSSRQNTRINLTNTDPSRPTAVHLFFVDGGTCSVADSVVCLTQSQTISFLMSDLDPGTTGYIVAVAVDDNGCPRNFNYLIGDEYVKFTSGHAANLGAEAISALAGGLPACDENSTTAVLAFDGVSYNQVPHTLAASSIPSRADGNDTMVVLNRFGGNLGTGAATLGTLFGLLFDDAERGISFNISDGCQLRFSFSNQTPRTAPRFENFIPAGRTGWAKFYSQGNAGIFGAMINFNANSDAQASAFNQGHNLHKLTLNGGMTLTIPVFPPNC